MSAERAADTGGLLEGLVERVTAWGLVAWAGLVAAAWMVDWRAAAGAGLGGGLGLGGLALHGALARGWRASLRGSTAPNRRRRAVLWAVWVLKWPVLGTVLWLALRNGWVSAGWLCVGVGLTPGVIVMMAAAAAVGRRRGERAKAGA